MKCAHCKKEDRHAVKTVQGAFCTEDWDRIAWGRQREVLAGDMTFDVKARLAYLDTRP